MTPSWNCGIFADFLLWWAKESGTDNWVQIIDVTSKASKGNIDILSVEFSCDPGFRVGIDCNLKYDGWDTQFYYTWFRTEGKDGADRSEITSSFSGNFYIDNSNGDSLTGPTYQKADISWRIFFNIFDWELGRCYWVSKYLSLRPFIGVKGGWIDQRIHSGWKDPNLPKEELFHSATENLRNDFWGVGPSCGLNTKWIVGHVHRHWFSLFGDFSGALMYGHWTFADVYQNDKPAKVSIDIGTISGAASMFRMMMGLGWDVAGHRDRFHFGLRIGCEMQVWLDQLQFYSFNTGRLANELTLQGMIVDLRFDY